MRMCAGPLVEHPKVKSVAHAYIQEYTQKDNYPKRATQRLSPADGHKEMDGFVSLQERVSRNRRPIPIITIDKVEADRYRELISQS